MAGTERIGFGNSKAKLLENAYYILTKTDKTDDNRLEDDVKLVKSIGAIPLVVPYLQHDYATAAISHVPHVVSASLVYVAHLSARLSCLDTSLVSLENYVVDLLLSLGYFADEDSSCHVGSIVLPHSADVEDYAVTVLALAVISDVMRISSSLCISCDRIE